MVRTWGLSWAAPTVLHGSVTQSGSHAFCRAPRVVTGPDGTPGRGGKGDADGSREGVGTLDKERGRPGAARGDAHPAHKETVSERLRTAAAEAATPPPTEPRDRASTGRRVRKALHCHTQGPEATCAARGHASQGRQPRPPSRQSCLHPFWPGQQSLGERGPGLCRTRVCTHTQPPLPSPPSQTEGP